MPRIKIDLDITDKTMSLRNRRAMSLGLTITYGILATMVIPFLLQKVPFDAFRSQLPTIMASGLIIAGLWGAGTLYLRDPVTDEPVKNRNWQAAFFFALSLGLALIMYLAVWLVTYFGSHSWASYDLLKSDGLITYVILGLLPVVAYIVALHAVAARNFTSSRKWQIVTAACMLVSLLAPWFWVGYKVYSDYHVM